MAVSISREVLIACALALSLPACAGEGEVETGQNEVLEYISEKVATATAELGKRVETCSEKARENETPLLEQSRLQELGAEPQDLVVALGHFNYVNSFQCESNARLALAYEVGTLASAQRQLNKEVADLEAIQAGLIYPSVDVLQYSVAYSKLKPALKEYFASVIGGEPFSLVDALEAHSEIISAGQ